MRVVWECVRLQAALGLAYGFPGVGVRLGPRSDAPRVSWGWRAPARRRGWFRSFESLHSFGVAQAHYTPREGATALDWGFLGLACACAPTGLASQFGVLAQPWRSAGALHPQDGANALDWGFLGLACGSGRVRTRRRGWFRSFESLHSFGVAQAHYTPREGATALDWGFLGLACACAPTGLASQFGVLAQPWRSAGALHPQDGANALDWGFLGLACGSGRVRTRRRGWFRSFESLHSFGVAQARYTPREGATALDWGFLGLACACAPTGWTAFGLADGARTASP